MCSGMCGGHRTTLGNGFKSSNSGLVASRFLGHLPGLRGGLKEENLFKLVGTRVRKTQECDTCTPFWLGQ